MSLNDAKSTQDLIKEKNELMRIKHILNEWKLDLEAISGGKATTQYPMIVECLSSFSIKSLEAINEWIAKEYFEGSPHKRETSVHTILPDFLQLQVNPEKPIEIYNIVGEAHELYWLIDDILQKKKMN